MRTVIVALVMAVMLSQAPTSCSEPADQPTEQEKSQSLDENGDNDGVGELQQAGPNDPLIEEDDPRWDCRTMGNGVCGPVIDSGSYVIEVTEVTPQAMAQVEADLGAALDRMIGDDS